MKSFLSSLVHTLSILIRLVFQEFLQFFSLYCETSQTDFKFSPMWVDLTVLLLKHFPRSLFLCSFISCPNNVVSLRCNLDCFRLLHSRFSGVFSLSWLFSSLILEKFFSKEKKQYSSGNFLAFPDIAMTPRRCDWRILGDMLSKISV